MLNHAKQRATNKRNSEFTPIRPKLSIFFLTNWLEMQKVPVVSTPTISATREITGFKFLLLLG